MNLLPQNRGSKQKAGLKIKVPKSLLSLLSLVFMIVSYHTASAQQKDLVESRPMVRIAEIDIVPDHLEAYKAILAAEAAASVKLEPGVIAIFPMYEKENTTQIRILEIYASKGAYEQHLKTPHFQKYKTTTANMVKSLKLVDMEGIDWATVPLIFKKLKEN